MKKFKESKTVSLINHLCYEYIIRNKLHVIATFLDDISIFAGNTILNFVQHTFHKEKDYPQIKYTLACYIHLIELEDADLELSGDVLVECKKVLTIQMHCIEAHKRINQL